MQRHTGREAIHEDGMYKSCKFQNMDMAPEAQATTMK